MKLWRSYPVQRVCIDRGVGRAFVVLGEAKKGLRHLTRAVKVAQNMGLGFELSRALLDLSAVKEEGRNENRAKAIQVLKKMKSVIPRAESWLLGDQYDEAVVAPEFDLEAWERERGPISPQIGADKS